MATNTQAALYGSMAGLPLALLVNRFLLGNTSGLSNAVAAAVGMGGGAATGLGINTYLQGRKTAQELEAYGAQRERQDKFNATNSEIAEYFKDRYNIPDSEEGRAFIRSKIAPYVTGRSEDEINSIVNGYVGLAEAEQYKSNDAETLLRLGTNTPLDFLSEENYDYIDKTAPRFSALPDAKNPDKLTRNQYDELYYGGLVGANRDEVFGELQRGDLGRSLRGNRAKLAAVLNYHNKLMAIAESGEYPKLWNKNNWDSEKVANIVDFLALQSMPERQRALVPLEHRITATQRAAKSNGYSYEMDRNLMTVPGAWDTVIRHGKLMDATENAAFIAGGPATSLGLMFLSDYGNKIMNLHDRGVYGLTEPWWSRDKAGLFTYGRKMYDLLKDPEIQPYRWMNMGIANRENAQKPLQTIAGLDMIYSGLRSLKDPWSGAAKLFRVGAARPGKALKVLPKAVVKTVGGSIFPALTTTIGGSLLDEATTRAKPLSNRESLDELAYRLYEAPDADIFKSGETVHPAIYQQYYYLQNKPR